jgi:hypothetical protein
MWQSHEDIPSREQWTETVGGTTAAVQVMAGTCKGSVEAEVPSHPLGGVTIKRSVFLTVDRRGQAGLSQSGPRPHCSCPHNACQEDNCGDVQLHVVVSRLRSDLRWPSRIWYVRQMTKW